MTTPRIYVASLSDYNAGRLVGQWIDLDETATAGDIGEAITAMLATSPEPIAEEWAIHDYDEMPNLGEYPDLETVARIARGIAKHGDPFLKWVDDSSYNNDPTDFEDQYCGHYDSEKDYAWEYIAETYGTDDLGPLANYIDYDAYARDLFMDMTALRADGGGIYVFQY